MVRWKRLVLLALPAPLLGAPMALGDTSSSSPGITRDDQREERFYNFDNGRQSGGGFKDPSDLIRRLQGARNLQRATEPTDTLDAALEDFAWPDEQGSSPEGEQTVDSVAKRGSGPVTIPEDLFLQVTPPSTQGATTASEEEKDSDDPCLVWNPRCPPPETASEEGDTDNGTSPSTAPSTTP